MKISAILMALKSFACLKCPEEKLKTVTDPMKKPKLHLIAISAPLLTWKDILEDWNPLKC